VMSLLNLTAGQFLALLVPVCAAVIGLYLYDRSRLRRTVSTLRFYRQAARSPAFARRRRIRQPWSLLLQLASLASLICAVGELQLHRWAAQSRDHVLMIESSSWMGAGDRPAGVSLMQEARQQALSIVHALPRADRLMIMRVDRLATAVTPFTGNRVELEAAVRNTQAGSTALDLEGALELARSIRDRSQSMPGEMVFVGSGRVMSDGLSAPAAARASNFRAILVGRGAENVGIRKLAARRASDDPSTWEIGVNACNYGSDQRHVELHLNFGSQTVSSRILVMGPQSTTEASFRLTSFAGGMVEAVLTGSDDYPGDDRASIRLPRLQPLRIQVFTTRRRIWEPLMSAKSFLDPVFAEPSQYPAADAHAGLLILDGFTPPSPPAADSIAIAADAGRRGTGSAPKLIPVRWQDSHPIAAGVHDQDVLVAEGAALTIRDGEEAIGFSSAGPVLAVSQRGRFRDIRFGFHPMDAAIRNQPAIPLIFANIVHWLAPDLFQITEISALSPGLVEQEVGKKVHRSQVKVLSARGEPLPFTLTEGRLRFYVGQPASVRVTLPGRELHYVLNLPEVGDTQWIPPDGAHKGAAAPPVAPVKHDLWPWLVLLSGLGLLLEWTLYGRKPSPS
jgi:hypothetical protein